MRENQTYAKAITRRRRIDKARRHQVVLYVLVVLMAVMSVIGAINYRKMYNHLGSYTDFTPVNYEKEKPVSIYEQISDITGGQNVDVLYNLAKCESGLRVYAVGINSDKAGSYDRGFYQINNYWHPEVSDSCAFDFVCSTRWTNNMIKQGELSQWVCSGSI